MPRGLEQNNGKLNSEMFQNPVGISARKEQYQGEMFLRVLRLLSSFFYRLIGSITCV